MEKGLTKSAIALSLAMFLFGGVAGFFVGYPVGRDASIDLFPTADVEAAGGMTLGEGTNDGIGMTAATIQEENYEEYGIMPIAESAQQVTATVTPAGAEDAVIDWAVTWKSGGTVGGAYSLVYGETVTDYVTVTPTSDGALTANVSCLQAFGEQIILTASIRGNESVKGTATVDYLQKYIGPDVDGYFEIHFRNASEYGDDTYNFDWRLNIVEYSTVSDLKKVSLSSVSWPTHTDPKNLADYARLRRVYGSAEGEGYASGYSMTCWTTDCLSYDYTKAATLGEIRVVIVGTETYASLITDNGGTAYLGEATNESYSGMDMTTITPFLKGDDFSNLQGSLDRIFPINTENRLLDWSTYKTLVKRRSAYTASAPEIGDNFKRSVSFAVIVLREINSEMQVVCASRMLFDPETIPVVDVENVSVAPGAVEF